MRYHPHAEEDIARVLSLLGKQSLDELFTSIPKNLQLARPLDLPAPLDERGLFSLFGELAGRNRAAPPFIGAGAYPHHVPAAVDQLLLRSEFYTSYTPYQPEVAQGTLQAIFEFQTFVSLLSGLPVANASMYDGATACAEAVLLALRLKKERQKVLLSRALHPSYRRVVETYLAATGAEIVEIPFDAKSGRTDLAALDKAVNSRTALVLLQSPNFFGVIEEVSKAANATRGAGALLGVAVSEALSLGMLQSPGALGADIAMGELQSFGNGVSFGGPGVGFFATREEYLRQLPGRLCGETVDQEGKRAFVLTLSTREQHIRREQATSNICTNTGLCALAATMHLAILGKQGLSELALLNYQRAHYARTKLAPVRFSGPTFNEFVVSASAEGLSRAAAQGISPGLALDTYYPELAGHSLVCVTELHDRTAIDALSRRVEELISMAAKTPFPVTSPGRSGLNLDEPLLFERGRPGRRGASLPEAGVPPIDPGSEIPAEYLRREIPGMPELSEPEVVRHFVRLSQWNYGIDSGPFPLGSCTMKYNPKSSEALARLPGFSQLHPMTPENACQGALQLGFELERALSEISGFAATTLQPAAGAQGEFCGLLMIRAYHADHGGPRKKVLIPDSAHGTNPASCALAGFDVVQLKGESDGVIHPSTVAEALAVHGTDVAALMMTNPNTLGIFERHIQEISELLHAKGALLYCDGANLNALLGVARPGDMGYDVMQFNLHKTFATPHGGGGPGAGPVGVNKRLEPYLPTPVIGKGKDGYSLQFNRPKSIGRLRTFWGNFGMWVRAYALIREWGPEGARRAGQLAVLNANYLRALLTPHYNLPFSGDTMHEVVFSDKLQKEYGVSALDIAKRLIDHGFHPPTIYFPLVVPGALMIEPTETESPESVEALAAALIAIAEEAKVDPEALHQAPTVTKVRRLDEVRAARKPVLRWTPKAE